MLDNKNDFIIVGVAGVFVAIAIAGVALLALGNGLQMPDLSRWGSGLLMVLVLLAIATVAIYAVTNLRQ